jgi:hypothetical protein
MSGHQGRVLLEQAIAEWAAGHELAPTLLASHAAEALRTLSPPHAVISTQKIAVTLASEPGGCVTIGALVDYFEQVGKHKAPGTIATTVGTAPVGAVLVDRGWIAVPLGEAAKRAAFAAGFAISTNAPAVMAQTINASAATRQEDPHPLPSGSEPGYLKMRQAQQRRDGERSAAEQVEALQAKLKRAEQGEAEALARLAASEAQNQYLRDQVRSYRYAQSESERERDRIAEQLREHAGIIEFMNPDNPLSPEEGRRLVAAWCELTECGAVDIVSEKGAGLGELCRRWLTRHFGEPPAVVVKRFVWALAWPARKKGGMIAKRQREKG